VVRQVVRDVIARIGRAGYEVVIFKENRLELARIPRVETVEIVEPKSAGPVVERTIFAGLPGGRVVVFPNPRGSIAICLRISATLPALFGMIPV
jgi:hypothetical protein